MTVQEYDYIFKYPLQKQITLTFSETGQQDIVLTNEHICSESMSLEESLCSSEDLNFGACEASCFKVRVVNNGSFKDKLLTVTMSFVADDNMYLLTESGDRIMTENSDYLMIANGTQNLSITVGKYRVHSDEPSDDRMWRDLTCYDYMSDILSADVTDWYRNLTFPMTLSAFRNSFFTQLGITQVTTTLPLDSLNLQGGFASDVLSGKTIIEAICQLNGVFGHINSDGQFQYVQLSTSNPLTFSWYIDGTGKYEDYVTDVITGIVARSEANDIGTSVGTDTNPWIIENNPLIYGLEGSDELISALTTLLSNVNTISYRPFQVDTYGNPKLPLGQRVIVNTKRYDTQNGYQPFAIQSYVLKKTMTGLQGLVDSVSATGNKKRDSQVNSIQSEITRTKGKMHVFQNEIDIFESTISETVFDGTEHLVDSGTNSDKDFFNCRGVYDSDEGVYLPYDYIYGSLPQYHLPITSDNPHTDETYLRYAPETGARWYISDGTQWVEQTSPRISGSRQSTIIIQVDLRDNPDFVDFEPYDKFRLAVRVASITKLNLSRPKCLHFICKNSNGDDLHYYHSLRWNEDTELDAQAYNKGVILHLTFESVDDSDVDWSNFGLSDLSYWNMGEDASYKEISSSITQLSSSIVLKVNGAGKLVLVQLDVDPTSETSNFTVQADNIDLSGKNINLNADDGITITSPNFEVTRTGVITAKSGTIAGWDISDTQFSKEVTTGTITDTTILRPSYLSFEREDTAQVALDGYAYLNYMGLQLGEDSSNISIILNSNEGSITAAYATLATLYSTSAYFTNLYKRSGNWGTNLGTSNLNTALTKLESQVVVQNYSATYQITASDPVTGAVTYTMTSPAPPSGYTPVAVFCSKTGARTVSCFSNYIESATQFKYNLYYSGNSSVSGTAEFVVFFLKS